MTTIEEIQQMTDEEKAKLNKKIAVKLVLTRIVAPVAIAVVAHVAVSLIVKKLDKNES